MIIMRSEKQERTKESDIQRIIRERGNIDIHNEKEEKKEENGINNKTKTTKSHLYPIPSFHPLIHLLEGGKGEERDNEGRG